MIDLEQNHLDIVKSILNRHIPGAHALVFGSRSTGRAKPHSDLDLAIDTGRPLSLSILEGIKHDFSESDLPMRVDVVDFQTVAAALRQIIESTGKPLDLS